MVGIVTDALWDANEINSLECKPAAVLPSYQTLTKRAGSNRVSAPFSRRAAVHSARFNPKPASDEGWHREDRLRSTGRCISCGSGSETSCQSMAKLWVQLPNQAAMATRTDTPEWLSADDE